MFGKFIYYLIATPLLLITVVRSGYAQLPMPANLLFYRPDTAVTQEVQRFRMRAFDATRMLPTGFAKNGTVDYTNVIQAALDNYAIVLMPDFPVLINDTGISVRSGQTIIFNAHSKLIVKPSRRDTYEVIRIHDAENVNVFFAAIYGDKNTHLDSAGQWGMGIAIRGSKNVRLIRPQVYDCWGDGIYIGALKKLPSDNIVITAPLLNGNRRNGLSITSASKVTITGGVIANSGGQMPMSGIDIEPNHVYDTIDNIIIDHVTTFGHPKYGIVISLQHLLGRQTGITNILIKDHTDDGSNIAMGIIGKPAADTLTGQISIIKPLWNNNRETAIRLPIRNFGLKVFIDAPSIKNPARANDMEKLNQYLQRTLRMQ